MNVRKLIVGVVVIAIFAAGYFLMNLFANQKELPPERPKVEAANYVKVNTVKYENIDTEIVAYGRITSSQSLNIIAEVGGRLLPGNINLKPGENFRQGQILCRIYDVEARLTLQSRKSEYLNLIASTLPDVKIDYPNRYNEWLQYFEGIEIDKPLPELPELTNLKLKTFLATKNILREYYSIRSAEENLRKYTIYAPYNGSISAVNLEVGTIVSPGTTIAGIIRTDKLELEIPVEVKDIRWVGEGTPVQVMSEDEGRTWEGFIIRKADRVDPNTQSINVYISVEAGPDSDLYDGLYLKAVIPGSTLESALEVPRRILQSEDEVFVVEQGMLKSKKVNIQKINNDNVLINGLEEGDSLVLEAPVNASENMKVKIFEPSEREKQQNPAQEASKIEPVAEGNE
jgi:membrane fusion protein, multidrug efflux system